MTLAAVLRVAVPTPLYSLYDYLAPDDTALPPPGVRVRIPFGRGETVGIVVATLARTDVAEQQLRPVIAVLDREPVFDADLMWLLDFAANYYRHPPGEVFAAALPPQLRRGGSARALTSVWRLTAAGMTLDDDSLTTRAPRQAQIVRLLRHRPDGTDAPLLDRECGGDWRAPMRRLMTQGRAERFDADVARLPPGSHTTAEGPTPTAAQRDASDRITASFDAFDAFLLDGITGSGKTEVYLRCIDELIAANRQTLVLVPEIALTPQLVNRFQRRFGQQPAVLHSGLGAGRRLAGWRAARAGTAAVIIGTRSAVFAPLPRPGMIVIDEEHDSAFKQQEGFRYSARDLAVARARRLGIPVVLGSATPSLESLYNARQGRYQRLVLPQRATGAGLPTMRLVDLRREPVDRGLSLTLRRAMQHHLAQGSQVLLFLNRRGYAPAWFCPGCGWAAECRRCDARMVWHRRLDRLQCHHCGSARAPEPLCPECSETTVAVGQGTQRIEETLTALFPDVPVARIDRDNTRRRGALEEMLAEVHRDEPHILIGTQMLTKGHHFPAVTLVGILDADQGLFGTDFRSNERLAQLVVQVAGRAGRAERAGEVLVQTSCPDHPLLTRLIDSGYEDFAAAALSERESAGWPPFSALAVLRAEATDEAAPQQFLETARDAAGEPDGIALFGPAPAPMARRAGRYRAQLLVQGNRGVLQRFIAGWAPHLDSLPGARRVRWSLDVDPQELF